MRRDERDVARARRILEELIGLAGMSKRELDRRLLEEESGTDVTRLLAGKLDLKLRHVLEICRVIGLSPHVFFNLLLEPEPSPLIERLTTVVDAGRLRVGASVTGASPESAPAAGVAALPPALSAPIAALPESFDVPPRPGVFSFCRGA